MAELKISANIEFTPAGVLIINRSFIEGGLEPVKFVHDPLFKVIALATDVPIPFCDVTTAKTIMLDTNEPILLKIDSVANFAIPLERFILLRTQATALFLSNPTINDAIVQVTIIGD